MKRAYLRSIAIAGLLAGLASCAASADSAGPYTGAGGASAPPIPCSADGQCAGTAACVKNVCVPRVTVEAAWAIEIRPPASSMTAALTELPTVAASGTTLALFTTDKITAEIVVNSANTGLTSAASIVASIPSLILGQPALTFEASFGATAGTNGCSQSACAALVIPRTVLDRPGTAITLVPSPTDQQSPPFSFPDTVLAPLVTLPIPATLTTLSGRVSTALGEPPPLNLFAARAFQQENAVSNAAMVDKDGIFTLFVPPAVASRSSSYPITLQLTPQAAGSSDPWFTMDPFVVSGPTYPIPPIMLAPYPNANAPTNLPFKYAVKGGDNGVPVQGALVHAATKLEPQTLGVTRFSRDGFTDADGLVGLTLIPGTANAPQSYDISVAPPASSPYATRCLARQPIVNADGTVMEIVLAPRPVVSGTVTTAAGAAAMGVTVHAARQSAPMNDCGTYGPGSTNAVTDAQGRYQLALDPGIYQIDYDPPSDAPLPRLTKLDIEVLSDLTQAVRLPAAALVEGDVHDSAGAPVPYATVSILQPVCDATVVNCLDAPTLLARTQTDADGHFRAIVPATGTR